MMKGVLIMDRQTSGKTLVNEVLLLQLNKLKSLNLRNEGMMNEE